MTPLSFSPATAPGIAASAAGSFATGATERTAKADAAGHSLAAGQHELAPNPLDGDPNTAADRDADGWTGGTEEEAADHRRMPSNTPTDSAPTPVRLRLPDDPCGGELDVTV